MQDWQGVVKIFDCLLLRDTKSFKFHDISDLRMPYFRFFKQCYLNFKNARIVNYYSALDCDSIKQIFRQILSVSIIMINFAFELSIS